MKDNYSPAIQQYRQIKEQNKDSILFFRIGDFYEMYFDDAEIASEELDISLTKRNCGAKDKAPSCGVPYHSCEAYVQRLVDKGYRVAICDPTSERLENGIQEREVVRVVTRGTVIDSQSLREGENNFLCVVNYQSKSCGICFVDITTGKLYLTELAGDDTERKIIEEAGKMAPSEILLNSEALGLEKFISFIGRRFKFDPYLYDEADDEKINNVISERFGENAVAEYDLSNKTMAAKALGSALIYINRAHSAAASLISEIDYYKQNQYMEIDDVTQGNLDLVQNRHKEEATLLGVLDETMTAMGKRMIKQMVLKPLIVKNKINRRLDAVEYFVKQADVCKDIRERLHKMCDIERTISRIMCGRLNIKDLIRLKNSLAQLPYIVKTLSLSESVLLRECADGIYILDELKQIIENSIDEEAENNETDIKIRQGYNAQIDECLSLIKEGKDKIDAIKKLEESRGIKGLKIKFSKTLGYYIETPKLRQQDVPQHYIQRQLLTNCGRYTTSELQAAQFSIENATEQAAAIEKEILEGIREQIGLSLMKLQKTAECIALIDVMSAFAYAAKRHNYAKPLISSHNTLHIIEGRHPVVEKYNKSEPYVPNDLVMNSEGNRTLIITGPNMAGKSTFMRQNALIVIMAQMGSFVPAYMAEIPIIDKIFTRIGASDSLAQSKSTFMTEMEECVNIINNATEKSLIIFDEIGRGTSTYDGMAIARSILEYCNDKQRLGAKTMFATHYHELCCLEQKLDGVKNYNVIVDDSGDDLVFTRRVARGSAVNSYGIRAAQMVGMRSDIIERANEILKQLQESSDME